MIPLRARASSKTRDISRQKLNKHTHNVNGKEGKGRAAQGELTEADDQDHCWVGPGIPETINIALKENRLM
ncbi:MAG: hypothetical protein AVO38_04540 [delta proteobacterium ML8_D]|nr:MAG: hypothetical protein AVO38_04540 [delta proteobacterium ML8_D]